ncbi:unnamed protein product [Cochlearia groenlandica]
MGCLILMDVDNLSEEHIEDDDEESKDEIEGCEEDFLKDGNEVDSYCKSVDKVLTEGDKTSVTNHQEYRYQPLNGGEGEENNLGKKDVMADENISDNMDMGNLGEQDQSEDDNANINKG